MFMTLGFLQAFTCVIALVCCSFLAFFQIQEHNKAFFGCITVPEWLTYGNIIAPGVLGFLLLMTAIFSCLRSRNSEKIYEIINWTCNTLALLSCTAIIASSTYIAVLYLQTYNAETQTSFCSLTVFIPYVIVQATNMSVGIFGLIHCIALCGTCHFFDYDDFDDEKM